MEIQIKLAQESDMPEITRLLLSAGLPFDDIDPEVCDFLLANADGETAGAAGLEGYDEAGLLRSMVVAEPYRGKKIGHQLLNAMEIYARNKNIRELYLLTETAKDFFTKYDFTVIARNNAPASILHTGEFQSGICASAVAMFKQIDHLKMKYNENE